MITMTTQINLSQSHKHSTEIKKWAAEEYTRVWHHLYKFKNSTLLLKDTNMCNKNTKMPEIYNHSLEQQLLLRREKDNMIWSS